VPEVLTTGDHGAIDRWRAAMARRATETKRPDLVHDRERSKKSAEAQRG
jgi:tRNA (guanine37-N1)-methyltransferase